jgi:hypothetical protein
LAVTVSLFIGTIPFHGLRLGIAGVLFSSLIFRQCNLVIDFLDTQRFSTYLETIEADRRFIVLLARPSSAG